MHKADFLAHLTNLSWAFFIASLETELSAIADDVYAYCMGGEL
jgi:hypothetical protein